MSASCSASCEIRPHVQSEFFPDQNTNLDGAVRRVVGVGRTAFRLPLSRKPDEVFILGCALGDEEWCTIRDLWRPSHPIVYMPPDEYDDLVRKNKVVYEGRSTDLVVVY